MAKQDQVILFDGVCKLCNAWAKFIIKYDKKNVFKLASVQSPQGQAILKYFGRSTETFDTMILVSDCQSYQKSTAFFKVIKYLPYPFKLIYVFIIIPRPIRDWLYDCIALNRYALFGQFQQCLLPDIQHENRYLK